jgi:RNA polymerase sigma factor (TIGR02999 family)|tara:strand:- start:11 stop:604 length:594 start_codon:yes stop_codon:yes gene_type:complete
MPTTPEEITRLLNAAADGDDAAMENLWRAAQVEIRNMAGALMAREARSANLQPTLLINEAFMRLNPAGGEQPQWENRAHFFGYIWRIMRQFLIDYARTKRRQKRGGGARPVSLTVAAGELANLDTLGDQAEGLVEALDRLKETSPRSHEVLWRRMALDQSVAQVAESLGISERTAAEDWRFARTWLRRELSREDQSP